MDLYQTITDEIIKHLENGLVPWKQPYKGGMLPLNYVTQKPYRGINVLLLTLKRYSSPYWLTFKQVQDMGGSVRHNEKSTLVVFWKLLKRQSEGENNQEIIIPCLRYYRVFNYLQVEGIASKEKEATIINPIHACEQIISEIQYSPIIDYNGRSACYNPTYDKIEIPHINKFINSEEYYSTLFHELIHSTGHISRLNRAELMKSSRFASEVYSKEELIAEVGSAFLCSLTGILPSTIANSAAYISGWLEALKNDRKLLIVAAAQAQKAADYILNRNDSSREEGVTDEISSTEGI